MTWPRSHEASTQLSLAPITVHKMWFAVEFRSNRLTATVYSGPGPDPVAGFGTKGKTEEKDGGEERNENTVKRW